jgi:hypothetical protein
MPEGLACWAFALTVVRVEAAGGFASATAESIPKKAITFAALKR